MKRKDKRNVALFVLRRLIIGVLIMTVAGMLLEGCGNKEERAEKVKAALEEKYGGEFEVMRVMGQGVMEDYFVAEAYNTDYPDLPFSLNMDVNDGTFMDGYVLKRGTNLIAGQAAQNLGSLQGAYYVHVQSMFPDSVSSDPEISLDAYLESENTNFFTIYLYVDPDQETPESLYSAVSAILKGMGKMEGSVEIFFADEKKMDQAREYVESHAGLENEYYEIGKDSHVIGIRFAEGALQITEDSFLDLVRSKM